MSLILDRKIKSNDSIQDPNIGRYSQVSIMWLYIICGFDNIEPTKMNLTSTNFEDCIPHYIAKLQFCE